MAIKAVIFDMGGVLLQTEDPIPRQQLAQEYNFQLDQFIQTLFYSDSARLAEVGKVTQDQHWQYVLAEYKVPEKERQAFIDRFWSGDRVDTTLVDLIRRLKGHYKMGLLSNAWDGARATIQASFHFLDVFDVSIFSAEVGLRKPDPQIFQLILDQLNLQPVEAVFIDDFQVNIQAANAFGLQTIHFTGATRTIHELDSILSGPADGAAH